MRGINNPITGIGKTHITEEFVYAGLFTFHIIVKVDYYGTCLCGLDGRHAQSFCVSHAVQLVIYNPDFIQNSR